MTTVRACTENCFWGCTGDSYPLNQIYGCALRALAGIGNPAACATPVLILASEANPEYPFNAAVALEKVGTPPKSVVPYLAKLLFHRSASVCKMAAKAIIGAGNLDKNQFTGKTGEPLILALRQWWEEQGSKQEWKD